MSDMMTFPDTWEEFEKSYGFTDNEEAYTNGARLIPSFRVKQWLDHFPSVHPDKDLIHLQKEQSYMQGYEDGQNPRKGKWIETEFLKLRECSCCHVRWGMYDVENFDFCPNCGADMREGDAE